MSSKERKGKKAWPAFLVLFVGIALSFYAMFKGSILFLILAAVFLVLGFFLLKNYMSSGQNWS